MPGIFPMEFSLDNMSVWPSSHVHFLAPFLVFIFLSDFLNSLSSKVWCRVTSSFWVQPCHSYFSSVPMSPEDGTRNLLGQLLSWDLLLKIAFCQVMIALRLSSMYCFLFIIIRTVPTPFHLLRKHSFLYYISQNFHLLFATQGWCPGEHILQSYWPLI